jgi:hypothetical protein
MTHQSLGNEVTPDGIVHRCSCGWVSRPCFSNMIASVEGQDHRAAAAGNAGVPERVTSVDSGGTK